MDICLFCRKRGCDVNHMSIRKEDAYFQRKATTGTPRVVMRYEDANGHLHTSEELALNANKEIRRKLAAIEFMNDFKKLSDTNSNDGGAGYRKALAFMTDNPTETIRLIQTFMRNST